MTSPEITINEHTVERLLGMRRALPTEIDTCDLGELALTLGGEAERDQVQAASVHLQQCSLCSHAVLILQELQAKGTIDPRARQTAKPGVTVAKRSVPSRRTLAFFVAAVLLAGFLAYLLGRGPAEIEDSSGLTIKGRADDLFVAVQRGPARFTARPMDKLAEGDRLGLFYHAESAGYLSVFSLDEQGKTTLLYPAGGAESARVDAGSEVALPDGAIVTEGKGCEWLVAVFSDELLRTGELAETIQNNQKTESDCRLELSIARARTIRVFPVTR